jgi:hypothetical protein
LGYSQEKAKYIILLYLINPGVIFNISIYSENLYFFIHLIIFIYMVANRDQDILLQNKEPDSNFEFFY